jgi:hypothetical protein
LVIAFRAILLSVRENRSRYMIGMRGAVGIGVPSAKWRHSFPQGFDSQVSHILEGPPVLVPTVLRYPGNCTEFLQTKNTKKIRNFRNFLIGL